MKKFFSFLVQLGKSFNENELISIGNELTYKIVIAIFPLLIFLINVLSVLTIDFQKLLYFSRGTIPDGVLQVITSFLSNIKTTTSPHNISSIMSWSLIIAIVSASSGFDAIIRGINKSYDIIDTRNIFQKKLVSVLLVLQFVFTIVLTAVLLIFGDVIVNFFSKIGLFHFKYSAFIGFISYLVAIFICLINVMMIYKVSCAKKIKLFSTLPGAIVTVVCWILSSKAFNIYVNNFSKYNAVYGSIGSLFIFIFWVNIIAIVLLLGSQINALVGVVDSEDVLTKENQNI